MLPHDRCPRCAELHARCLAWFEHFERCYTCTTRAVLFLDAVAIRKGHEAFHALVRHTERCSGRRAPKTTRTFFAHGQWSTVDYTLHTDVLDEGSI